MKEYSDLYDFRLFVLHETDKAWHVAERLEAPFWIPKSQCARSSTGLAKGTMPIDDFAIPEWLAREKGLL